MVGRVLGAPRRGLLLVQDSLEYRVESEVALGQHRVRRRRDGLDRDSPGGGGEADAMRLGSEETSPQSCSLFLRTLTHTFSLHAAAHSVIPVAPRISEKCFKMCPDSFLSFWERWRGRIERRGRGQGQWAGQTSEDR